MEWTMDLNSCLTFVTVLECGSFSAAARKLQIPRSTVSARVASLETQLGTRLLRRTTRQIALTEDGRSYFEQVAPAIRALREANERAMYSGTALTGSIRISVPLDFPFDLLSKAIVSFRASHPGVRFDVIVDDSVNDFVADNVDMAIRGGHPGSDDFVAKRIASFRFGVFASPDYVQRCEETPHAESRPDSRLVFEQWSNAGHLVRSASSSLPALEHAVAANCFALLKQLAIDGAGAAILPAHMCEVEVRERRLVELDPGQSSSAEMGLFIVYPSRKDINAKVRAFSEHLVSALETGR
jgi:DNA-binding transcriptional LysR family regulator